MKTLLALSLLSLSAVASDFDRRPPSFSYNDGQAVFVDIQKAYYDINYDTASKTASVVAHIEFESIDDAGYMVFDSLQEPTAIRMDGQSTSNTLTATPDKRTFVRVVNSKISKGSHLLEVELPLKEYVAFSDKGVSQAYFMGDLNDREYMEKYFPTNFLFDSFPITFNINFNDAKNQVIYANGVVTQKSENEFTVEYKAEFNNACPYFHTVPAGAYTDRRFTYTSIDGRVLPVLVYAEPSYKEADFDRFQANTLKILAELEGDYGPFLHPSVTILITRNSGGMEYSGATTTAEGSLGHELFHSYYARGVIPAEGNSGWIDEALARWRDRGYQRLEKFEGKSNIAALGTYNRLTDRRAYDFGSQVMGYFDAKFKAQGGLKPFLKKYAQTHSFKPITTQDFIQAMNAFYGVDNSDDFKRFVMDTTATASPALAKDLHHKPTHDELMSIVKGALK